MEGDRVGTLIIQAARTGAIDFGRAKLLDRHWWLKLKFILNNLETDSLFRILKARQDQHLAAILTPNISQSSFDTHWSSANDAIGKMTESLFPWMGDMSSKAVKNRNIQMMADAWKQRWGDPKDPKVKANIDATVAEMYRKQRERHEVIAKMKQAGARRAR